MTVFDDKLNLNLEDVQAEIIKDRDSVHDKLVDLNDGSFPVFMMNGFGIFMMKIEKESGSTIVNAHDIDYNLYDFLDEVERQTNYSTQI